MKHSKIVGGSTAKRVINCPGSVALVAKMPPQVENKYMAEGLLLHACMEELLADGELGDVAAKHHLTPDQADKLAYCLKALDEIDPDQSMVFNQEVEVAFEGVPGLSEVFGNVDLIGRLGNRVIVLDWKFGDGVIVEAEDNHQGLFYAAAAMNTTATKWAFDGATEIEIVIVQPFETRRWVTTFKRLDQFVADLQTAVRTALRDDAPTQIGDHCRFCTAKTICPSMTGAVERTVHQALAALDPEQLGRALTLASQLEDFIADARKLAQDRLEKNLPVPGYKLVAKRATRQWADPARAQGVLLSSGFRMEDITATEFLSPAQMEKVCKKAGVTFPTDQVVAVSSGNTIAPESDPRPAVVVLGDRLRAALTRVQ